MRTWRCFPVLAVVFCAACGLHHDASGTAQSLTSERAAAIEKDVRAYMATVAHDITQEGPAAWRRHLADSPSFFMASEGRLVFPDSAAAKAAIQGLTQAIKHIELQWGPDLRVDPLAPELAAVGSTYHEILDYAAGNRADETGFFTAVAEHKDGRWQFRNAHWSVAGPAPVR